jgi:hypothetical protein
MELVETGKAYSLPQSERCQDSDEPMHGLFCPSYTAGAVDFAFQAAQGNLSDLFKSEMIRIDEALNAWHNNSSPHYVPQPETDRIRGIEMFPALANLHRFAPN